jgi:hypothetical protein
VGLSGAKFGPPAAAVSPLRPGVDPAGDGGRDVEPVSVGRVEPERRHCGRRIHVAREKYAAATPLTLQNNYATGTTTDYYVVLVLATVASYRYYSRN